MMGPTMARYADEGKVVALVTCTHGEGGGNGTGREGGPALGVVREAELRKCLGILGVRHLYFLNQPDWAYTESVQATLAKWGHEETLRRLVRLVRLLRPEVICTMDPAPVGGQHGHHQAAGRLATEAFEAAADPNVFPELNRDEGLAPWRVRKLYWSSFGGAATVHIATDGVAKGRAHANIAARASTNSWPAWPKGRLYRRGQTASCSSNRAYSSTRARRRTCLTASPEPGPTARKRNMMCWRAASPRPLFRPE